MKNNETFLGVWSSTVQQYMNAWKNALGTRNEEQEETTDSIKNESGNLFNNSMKYMEQMWKPFMQFKSASPFGSGYFNLWDKSSDTTFNQFAFTHKIFNQFNGFMHGVTQNMINSGKNLAAVNNLFPSLNSLSKIYPHTLSNWYLEFLHTAQRSFAPMLNLNGKTQWPDMQSAVNLSAKMSSYANKLSRMQFLLVNTSFMACEKLMNNISHQGSEGTVMKSFDDFYNEWSAVNEEEFTKLFHSKEYIMLQEDLISLYSDLVKNNEAVMEKYLKPFPIALRSEIDDVYKSNHDLRTRMNKVENLVES